MKGKQEKTVEAQKEEFRDDIRSSTPNEARQHALEDARRVLDHEFQSLNDITQKAWRVVQFNGLVATVFAALVPTRSGLTQIGPISGVFLVGAIIALGYSTYTAYRTQERESVNTGPETKMYRAVANYSYDEDDYLSHSLKIHASCLDSLQPSTEEKSEDVDKALLTSILGVILLVVGSLLLFIL